jgi:dienelactone hydrolase
MRGPAPGRARALRRGLSIVLAVAGAVLGGPAVAHHLRGAALVVEAGADDGWMGRMAAWSRHPHRRQDLQVASRHGPLRARLYSPSREPITTVLLVPGVHASGVDEPRLVSLADRLAARDVAVLTIEAPDLVHYRITARTVDVIEDAARWLAGRGEAARGGVGVAGVSFAGGLSVSAAGRPSLRERVRFVLSLGGHGDLRRTLRFLCSGTRSDGRHQRPHDYGLAIVLLALADRLAPADQAGPLREAILVFLEASRLDGLGDAGAEAAFARARAAALELPEPAAGYMRLVNARDVETLGRVLLPLVDAQPLDPAMSPELSPPPTAPVYLLHGAADDVIPCDEALHLAAHLSPHTRVRVLVSPLLRHAEAAGSRRWTDVARMAAFWSAALEE